MSFDAFFTLEAPPIKKEERFDPSKKKNGGKRANRTAVLSREGGPAPKKRKGALTADKLEAAGNGGNGNGGVGGSSGSGAAGL